MASLVGARLHLVVLMRAVVEANSFDSIGCIS